MSVLMTGGTGFLGLHLLRNFLLLDRRVTLLSHAGSIPAFERVRAFLSSDGALDRLPRALEELVAVTEIDLELPDLGLSREAMRAVTQDVDDVWHVAATVMLDGRDEQVWQTNVFGTQAVLRLVDEAPARTVLRYVSTAFAVGRRCQGDVYESDSDGASEFENVYERSKHAAEAAVREWAEASGRSVLILRPSILVPGNLSPTDLPEHTMRMVGQIAARLGERRAESEPRLVLRIGADPRSHLNLVQVDWAAETMLRLADRFTTGISALHVVHDSDVPMRSISAAVEEVARVRIRMMPAMPAAPTGDERTYHRLMSGFLPYLYHCRRFDTSKLRAALPDLSPSPPIGREQLRRWVTPDAVVVDEKVAA